MKMHSDPSNDLRHSDRFRTSYRRDTVDTIDDPHRRLDRDRKHPSTPSEPTVSVRIGDVERSLRHVRRHSSMSTRTGATVGTAGLSRSRARRRARPRRAAVRRTARPRARVRPSHGVRTGRCLGRRRSGASRRDPMLDCPRRPSTVERSPRVLGRGTPAVGRSRSLCPLSAGSGKSSPSGSPRPRGAAHSQGFTSTFTASRSSIMR